MKKIIIELILKHFDFIFQNWASAVKKDFGAVLTDDEIDKLIKDSLNILMDVLERSDYSIADQYLVDLYLLASNAGMDLLKVSNVFSYGRYAVVNYLEDDVDSNYDPIILLGFIEEIIEQIFARYSVMHQEAKMKEVTADRDRLATKLEINQQYLKNILHSSDSAILVIDEKDRITEWNKGAELIFGFTEKEISGAPAASLFPNTEEYRDELNYIREAIKSDGFFKINETERVAKNGKHVSVQLTGSVLKNANGEYAGRTVIVKDFTEVKQLKQQVDQSEKLAVIGQLAAGVAHEIGNPLASISSLVQILQRKSEEEFFRTTLANIKENIDRISRIVRELVDFSRPPGYEKMYIQINDILKTALGIVKYDKRVKDIFFDSKLAPSIPKINVIPDQLLQVFVNILFNALDALEGTGTIKVRTYHDDKFLYVELLDNGCGIEEENLDKLFNPFYTTKEVGKGTGLGLAVSYGIIKKFNGDILVESQLGAWSCFTVKLPLIENQ
ncbi:MAG: PAS domain S-box protein [Melioribacteraceae bacterium]|nr:PAS domain S-box protein [Melioribacteraceae bacterium]